jgi:hypothetical protein
VPLYTQDAGRIAITSWCSRLSAPPIWRLRQQLRKAGHDRIAAYAAEMAGTHFDLDPDLEAAGIEHLVKSGKTTK